MNLNDLMNDVIAVVNSEHVATLSLSKGGWEGWLQCELWHYLSVEKKQSVEREVPYPTNSQQYCDLVIGGSAPQLWVELKAFGIFREGDENRFLDGIAVDVDKLHLKPAGSKGLALVVVPKGIGESFKAAILSRRLSGFQEQEETYVSLYYMDI